MKSVKRRKNKRVFYTILTFIVFGFWVLAAVVILSSGCVKNYYYPLKYKETVFEYADEYDLERALVFAVIKVESGFDKNAKSTAGAIGLMQITPSTAEYIANCLNVDTFDLQNEDTNIKFGCFYIRYLFNRFRNTDSALCAYNAGEGNVSIWLQNEKYSDDSISLKTIPFKETQEYLGKIKETFAKYKNLYGEVLDKPINFD